MSTDPHPFSPCVAAVRTTALPPEDDAAVVDRRGFFNWVSAGLGTAALYSLLARERPVHAHVPGEAEDPPPHHPPRAVRAVHVFLCGGLSHIDSFDYRPELERYHGQPLPVQGEKPDVFFGQIGLLRASDFAYSQRGASGLWISELFPHLAERADELTIIRSMVAETSNHTPATFQANTGFRLNGFPVLGSWLSFGLGAESDDLPAYVVLPDARGKPAGGSINWSNGFLPARHQGVPLASRGPAIRNLQPTEPLSAALEQQSRALLEALNRRHLQERGTSDVLAARIKSYELAARMQLAVPEAADLEAETAQTHSLYGIGQADTDDFGRSCLLARRLLERGVRFVQLFSGGAFGSPRINWDGHEDVKENHTREARRIDQPLAGLLADLRQRGLLDDTLVIFSTEFGRTPFTQSADGTLGAGRDHNQYGFSTWLAGAGLRHGLAHGSTDPLGLKAVENVVTWHDFHATILHLLGIDHERLTFYHNGIRRRLTNVHGHVIREILA
ncbi:MAG: DUF1501 domain-containing protein [Pirellulales bacterium]|nr:DUF1501 domain-containing protein [Pirellulales bacterium]